MADQEHKEWVNDGGAHRCVKKKKDCPTCSPQAPKKEEDEKKRGNNDIDPFSHYRYW